MDARHGAERRMFPAPSVDWYALSPELILLGTAAVCLLSAVLVPARARRAYPAFVAAAGFVAAGVVAAFVFNDSESARPIVHESAYRDQCRPNAQIDING